MVIEFQVTYRIQVLTWHLFGVSQILGLQQHPKQCITLRSNKIRRKTCDRVPTTRDQSRNIEQKLIVIEKYEIQARIWKVLCL